METKAEAALSRGERAPTGNFRWWAKKILPKPVVDFLRNILPESIYYPSYGQTTLSDPKIKNVVALLESCLKDNLPGDIVECGVFRGGSLIQLALAASRHGLPKHIHGIDTFEGHPYESHEDVPMDGKVTHKKGLFSGNQMEKVNEAIRKNKVSDHVTLHKGLVEDILPKFANHEFCFAHLDMDLYQSTNSALQMIAPRVVKGGVVCFDDYGAPEAPGVKKAADEILGAANITVTMNSRDGYQAYWKKE